MSVPLYSGRKLFVAAGAAFLLLVFLGGSSSVARAEHPVPNQPIDATCTPDGQVLLTEGTDLVVDLRYENLAGNRTNFVFDANFRAFTSVNSTLLGPARTLDTKQVFGGGGLSTSTTTRLTFSTTDPVAQGGIPVGADEVIIFVTTDVVFTGANTIARIPGGVIVATCVIRLSVLPAGQDSDGDGLPDDWERNGFDFDRDGKIDPTIDVDLPRLGANPNHKDLFLELDYMSGQEPRRDGIQAMKAAFAAAPVNAGGTANPDGQPGITLRVDTGALTDATGLVGDNLGGGNTIPTSNICDLNFDGNNDKQADFYAVKAANFAAARRAVFRYAISAKGCDLNGDGAIDSGGWGELGGNDFIEYNHDGGTVMHEAGHTLDLDHGGKGDPANCKPNHVSVMNYDNQFGIQQAGGGTILDYSPPRFPGGRGAAPLPTLVENKLSESISSILDPTDATNRFVFVNANGTKVRSALNQQVNWNGDVDPPFETGPFPLRVNIDTNATGGGPIACANNSTTSVLNGADDWSVISLPFLQFGDSASGAINQVTVPEPNLAELLELQEDLNTTDLALTKADAPDPVAAGGRLVYTLTVANNGPNPASRVRVVDTLPAGVNYVSDTAGCVQAPAGTLTCALGELLVGASRQINVTVEVAADAVHKNGAPLTITNTATVTNLAGPDPTASNNGDAEQTAVTAQADLAIVSFQAQGAPARILIGQPVDVTLRTVVTNNGLSAPIDTVLDATAAASAGASVSPATSSRPEPALGLGENRTIDQRFSLSCTQPGLHTFTFTNEISPLRAGDTDPDATNNRAVANFQADCVLPVAINIKPGSSPNSINPRGASITVAALTTTAGEYGLPSAFNAAAIDALSVRFGAPNVVAAGGGAAEVHRRGHLEDSVELDEKTEDGDLDMVLHFRPAQTGIGAADTRACLTGEFVVGGSRFRFFGCDAIHVVG